MIQKIAFYCLLFLILQSCNHAQNFNKAKLDSFFVALKSKEQNMGSIAISQNGVLVYQNAIGYSQVNKDVKKTATIETQYRIGSITKMFTATMIFQLISEGKLSLETPLATYFSQLPNARKITIREMLDHRSGLHNFTNDSLYFTYSGSHKSEAEMTAIFASQKSDFEPNTKAAYSNTNFVLLGYIIEKLTGKTYAEELKNRITSKIGLAHTYYSTKTDSTKDEAFSYNYLEQRTQRPVTDMSTLGGAGGIISTPADLVKFINSLFEGKLINSTSLALMKTMRDNYGMALFPMQFFDEKGYGHTGSVDGFYSILMYFPQEKLALAYSSNGTRYSYNDVVGGALSIYFNRAFAIPDFKAITLKDADLDQYIGKYSSPTWPQKMVIIKKNATLFAQVIGQSVYPLVAQGNNKFIFASAGAILQFEPTKKTFTLVQGNVNFLFTRID